jgi:hypothetical protein
MITSALLLFHRTYFASTTRIVKRKILMKNVMNRVIREALGFVPPPLNPPGIDMAARRTPHLEVFFFFLSHRPSLFSDPKKCYKV